MCNLANSLRGQGKYAEAEQMEREVLDVQRRVLGPEHPFTLVTMDNLALPLRNQGKHAEAERFFREVDPFRKVPWKPKLLLRQFGEEHTVTRVAATMLRDAAAEKSESEPKKVHCAYVLHLQIALFDSLKADISSCASSGAAA
jgi:hypothetical protein